MHLAMVLKLVAAVAMLVIARPIHAALITSEDFEGGATGWNDNTTTVGNSNFTEFLGRFGKDRASNQEVFKTYSLSGAQTQVDIQFDFYEIDSWDEHIISADEFFQVYIDDTLFSSIKYRNDQRNEPGGIVTNLLPATGNTDLGFNSRWADQTYRYSFSINTTEPDIKLGFGATTDQSISDESWGVDNVIITDNSPSSIIPEPSSVALFSLGAMSLFGYGWRYNRNQHMTDDGV